MAKMLYQGHGSYRLSCAGGRTIYIDPYAGEGYDVPADLILVTHEHYDHNEVGKMPHAPGCRVIRAADALRGGKYGSFDLGYVKLRAVEAYNKNHPRGECVGFVIETDGVKLYAAGDTSMTEDMRGLLPGMGLDYAVFPGDGVYNMDAAEAAKCADAVGARHSIPVHLKPGALYDEKTAARFTAKGRLLVRPGETIELVPEG